MPGPQLTHKYPIILNELEFIKSQSKAGHIF